MKVQSFQQNNAGPPVMDRGFLIEKNPVLFSIVMEWMLERN